MARGPGGRTPDIKAPLVQANAALEARQYETAYGLAREHLKHPVRGARAALVAAQALTAMERLDEAHAVAQDGLQAAPQTALLWYQMALIERQRKHRPQAVEACLQAIGCDPRLRPAFNALRLLLGDKSVDVAVLMPRLMAIPETEANVAFRSSLLAEACTRVGRMDDAIVFTAQATAARAGGKTAGDPPASPGPKHHQVDFIVIGAQKAGTTSLHGYLGHHPRVLLPNKKEIHFFSTNHERGLPWYLAHFPLIEPGSGFVTGEASPSYFWAKGADDRILAELPPTQLFLLLRHPADRFISAYHHGKRMTGVQRPLDEFVRDQIRRKRSPGFDADHDNTAIGVSTYPAKLRRWLGKFGPERCQVLIAEDLFQRPAQVMAQVHRTLGLAPHEGQYKVANAGAYSKDDGALRDQLTELFQGEMREVEDILGRSTGWLSG